MKKLANITLAFAMSLMVLSFGQIQNMEGHQDIFAISCIVTGLIQIGLIYLMWKLSTLSKKSKIWLTVGSLILSPVLVGWIVWETIREMKKLSMESA